MNVYETVVIFNDKLTEDEVGLKVKELFHKIVHSDHPIEDTIPTTVHEIKNIGKKNLAYDIKGHSAGWYTIYTYRTEHERVTQLKRIIGEDDDVLKFITIKLDDEALAEVPNEVILEETVHDAPKPKEIDAFDLIFGND